MIERILSWFLGHATSQVNYNLASHPLRPEEYPTPEEVVEANSKSTVTEVVIHDRLGDVVVDPGNEDGLVSIEPAEYRGR